MFHALCWGLPYFALMVGCRFIQNNYFTTPEEVLEMIVDHGVTFSAGVPVIWQGIRNVLSSNINLARQIKLERLVCGGSSPPTEMMKWYWDYFRIDFIQGWGMTETNPYGTVSRRVAKYKHLSMTPKEKFNNVTKCGLIAPGLEMQICNRENLDECLKEDGKSPGELLIRGPWITGSYWKGAGKKNFHKGWLITGDV